MPDTSYHSWTMPTVDGSTDTWGQILNDMFDNEIDADVERRGTLANRPAAVDVPNGAKYLVTSGSEVGTVYVESSDSWVELGRFVDDDPAFGQLTANQIQTVSGNTISDIDTAVSNYNYVKLASGDNTGRKSYTGTGTITFNGNSQGNGENRHVVVDARGANIECDGEVLNVLETNAANGKLWWFGGYFQGNNATGDLAARFTDALFCRFFPELVRGCEIGLILENENSFSEFFRGHVPILGNNVAGVAVVGNGGTMPGSFANPSGTQSPGDSFRNCYLTVYGTIASGSGSNVYGVYSDKARMYASDLRLSFTGNDADSVGWQMSNGTPGAFPGTRIIFLMEQAGTGIAIPDDNSHYPWTLAHFSGLGTDVSNTSNFPFYHWQPNFQGSGGGIFGWSPHIDNTQAWRWNTSAAGGEVGKQIDYPYEYRQPALDYAIRITNTDSGNTTGRFRSDNADNFRIENGSGSIRLMQKARLQDMAEFEPRGDPTTGELNSGNIALYHSDGTGTGAAGDLVFAINDGGTIETAIVVDESAEAT